MGIGPFLTGFATNIRSDCSRRLIIQLRCNKTSLTEYSIDACGRDFCPYQAMAEQGDGEHRLYGGGIRKASFLMPA